RDRAGEPVRVLGQQPQPDEPTPVLTEQRDVAQIECVEQRGPHPLDMARVRMIGDLGRLVRAAEPDEVRGDDAAPRRSEYGDDFAVQETPRRFAVQAHDDGSVSRAGADVADAQRTTAVAGRDLDVTRFESE